MRRLVGPCVLSLVCGCYLLSDEPKARKQSGTSDADSPASGPSFGPDEAGALAETGDATPAGECPTFLTGIETSARTLASSCAAVRVRGTYRIDGGSLTVEPGVELRFEADAVLEVGRDRAGVLTLAGTPEQPIHLVADTMIGDAGGWQGVRLYAQAGGSALRHVELRGAGTATEAALWSATEAFTAEDLRISNAPGLALELVSERAPTLTDVSLAGTGTVARVSPSAAAALHSTQVEPTANIAVASGKLATTLEWPAQRYRIEGVIRIEGDAERPAALTLAPGTTLYFTPEARLIVGGFGPGSLSASASVPSPMDLPAPEGSPAGPIRLLAANDTRPGSWSGIHVQDQGQLDLRGVEIGHGGARDEGVVVGEGKARISLEDCVLHDNLVGVELRGLGVSVDALTGNEFRATPLAIAAPPTLVSAIGPDNRYDALARIDVTRGKIEADATWTLQAAPLIVRGNVFVDAGATLTVAPGSRLGFAPGVVLGVGYYQAATLDMRGTAEAPIVLEPASNPAPEGTDPTDVAKPLPWTGIVLGAQARKTRFEHVRLRGTEGAAGIELRDGAEATLVKVDCAGCAHATVAWDCASKVGNIGVTASAGTPTAMASPGLCP
jgi:hypothetical protein